MKPGLLVWLLLVGGMLLTLSCKQTPAANRSALPFGSIDIPTAKAVVQGSVQVAGWALSDQPIQEVSIYVDGKYLATASMKIARPDVAAAKPNYKDAANCGWTTMLNSNTLTPGWHELVVQAKAEDGATRDLGTLPVLVQR